MELSATAFPPVLILLLCQKTGDFPRKMADFTHLKNAENIGKTKDFLCMFLYSVYVAFMALGCSISMPDINQSNSRQVRLRTSDLSRGHR